MSVIPFACSLRVTDPAASLVAIERGLAGLVAAGRLHEARMRFDHVAITVDATTRDEAMHVAREILHDLGARRVQFFAALPLRAAHVR